MAGKIYRYLAEDHACLDALLERATARLDTIDVPVYAQFRAQLLKHIAMEEKILLPAAQRLGCQSDRCDAPRLGKGRLRYRAVTGYVSSDGKLRFYLCDRVVAQRDRSP